MMRIWQYSAYRFIITLPELQYLSIMNSVLSIFIWLLAMRKRHIPTSIRAVWIPSNRSASGELVENKYVLKAPKGFD